jgi:hypothetical protein
MKNISDFFSIFNNKASKEINKRLKIIEIIKKHTKITLEMKDIGIVNNVITVKSSQILKNEINIKKTKILEDIRLNIQEKIIDIR